MANVSHLLNIAKTARFKRRELKILVIKLDHLGDFILGIPALAKLKAKYPYALIDVIVGSWNVPIAQEMRLFTNIFAYDFFKRRSSERPSTTDELLASLLSKLGKYDIAIDLRRFSESRFLLLKVHADIKVAYQTLDPSVDAMLDIGLQTYQDIQFKSTPLNETSIANQMVALIDALPSDINDFITFPSIGKEEDRIKGTIAIFPKAGTDAREWDKSNFIELVELLRDNESVKGIDIYFANAREAADFPFETHGKLRIYVGLEFADLARALSRNAICIANNSGGAHLASYLGLCVVAIYSGHELASEWGPQFHESYVIHRGAGCAPCHGGKKSDCPNGLFCLNDIGVADVYNKTVEALFGSNEAMPGSKVRASENVSLQMNSDTIVRGLISSISGLLTNAGKETLAEIAVAISRNHPKYPKLRQLKSITPTIVVDHRSSQIDWENFGGCEPEFRWSDGNVAAMRFRHEYSDAWGARGRLVLVVEVFGRQRIIAKLNQVKVFDAVEEGTFVALNMRVSNLESGDNKLEFELPDARMPDNGDSRKVAIGVRSFRVEADGEDNVP